MPKFRHEINLLNSSFGNGKSDYAFNFDPTQYSGACTYYMEVVYTNTGAASSYTLDSAGLTWTINFNPASVPTLLRYQLVSPNPQLNLVPYTLTCNSTTTTTFAARFIIIQDTGNEALANCETQIEIGSFSSVTAQTIPTGATASNQTNPKYWFYDSSKWDMQGPSAFYFEAVFSSGQTKTASTVQLQVADGTGDGFTGWANVTQGSTLTTALLTHAAPIRHATNFNPINGRWYRIVSSTPASKSPMNVYNAKIVVRQGSPQVTVINNKPTNTGATGLAGSGGISIVAQGFNPGATPIKVVTMSIGLNKNGSPIDGIICEIRDSLGGTVIATSNITVPSGTGYNTIIFALPVALAANTDYVLQIKRTAGITDASNCWSVWNAGPGSTYAGGYMSYYSGSSWSNFTDYDICFSMNGPGPGITKFQPQYLILNTLAAAGTALQKKLTNWDSSEWGNVSNVYKFQVEASNGSNSIIQLLTADGVTIVAAVTLPDNAGTGVTTMPP